MLELHERNCFDSPKKLGVGVRFCEAEFWGNWVQGRKVLSVNEGAQKGSKSHK